ncbi:hypothetical protein CALCODRAFT_501185 [Calocera cornea HHB12733]|uniref:Mediator of RNA polymerase II transcription subunit 10 n=1 Tax=Calocera cornea HHB12733 TaxID=1353952 RepID=A0A165DRB3_9BASI|nr:hypothetical protein CALCODRAFT_501185 [Calocera cornea HHB12733]
MSAPSPLPAPHARSPAPSAPQTPGASSPDDSSDSDAAPYTPFTPGDSALSPGASPTTPSAPRFGLKASDRRRPEGTLGKVELLLEGLAEELNTLQTRAEAVYAPRREEDGPLIQATVREVVDSLVQLDELAPLLEEWVPVQVLEYLDEGRNPDDYTRTMLELTAAENQFTNGKVHAVHSYLQHLSAGLADAFPAMAPYVPPPQIPLSDGDGEPAQEKERELRSHVQAVEQPPDGGVGKVDAVAVGAGISGSGDAQEGQGGESAEGEPLDVGMEVDLPPASGPPAQEAA